MGVLVKTSKKIEKTSLNRALILKGLGRFLTDDELFDFCQMNTPFQIERDKNQNLTIMEPIGGESGIQESEVTGELYVWNKEAKSGKTFSTPTGFYLPNGALKSSDGSWMSLEKWEKITPDARKKFLYAVPDFIVEIRSPSDSLTDLKAKMDEWIENGVQLAWLIDPRKECAYIYRTDGSIDTINGFDKKLSGENVLRGFEFDLAVFKEP
jgi:Uma2 family endonuclease